jgi:hypothetical protein
MPEAILIAREDFSYGAISSGLFFGRTGFSLSLFSAWLQN